MSVCLLFTRVIKIVEYFQVIKLTLHFLFQASFCDIHPSASTRIQSYKTFFWLKFSHFCKLDRFKPHTALSSALKWSSLRNRVSKFMKVSFKSGSLYTVLIHLCINWILFFLINQYLIGLMRLHLS